MRYEELTIEECDVVLEAFRSSKIISKLLTLDGCQDDPVRTILREARKHDAITNYVLKGGSDQTSETGKHQGVIAYAVAYEYIEVKDILEAAEEKRESSSLIPLDGIEDPRNLGAIIRTASLAGAHGIIIPRRHAVGLAATVARTSAGALSYMPVAKITNPTVITENLKKKGMWFVYVGMGGGLMYKMNLEGPIGPVVEGEKEGVGELMRKRCDMVAPIPMKGDVDFLNTSAVVGMLAYEIIRQYLEMQFLQRERSDNDMKTVYKPAVKLTAAVAAVSLVVSSIQVPVMALAYTKPAGGYVLTPIAPGATICSNEKATLDASSVPEGHIMAKYTGNVDKTKVQVTKSGSEIYTYDLSSSGIHKVFPLFEGSGSHSVKILENIQGNQYSQVFNQSVNAITTNQPELFLYPNQYANFNAASVAIQTNTPAVTSVTDQLEVVSNVCSYIINSVIYDTTEAGSVQSGCLSNTGVALAQEKGICFDCVALMTTMLRSQNTLVRLVMGYAGNPHHAWINVYLGGQGWVNNIIYFDDSSWKPIGPTSASPSGQSQETMQHVGNGSNYGAKYSY